MSFPDPNYIPPPSRTTNVSERLIEILKSQVKSYNYPLKSRDPERIPVFCECLADVWSLVPDWRFGQLVINLLGRDPGLFYLEDEDSLKKLKAAFEQLNK